MNRPSRLARNAALAGLAAALAAGCSRTDQSNAATHPPSAASANVGGIRATNSDAAVKVLLGVAEARAALQRKDPAGALAHVNATSATLTRITDIPLVPIYTELAQSSFLAPIETAKKEAGGSVSQSQAVPKEAEASGSQSSATVKAPGAAPLVAQSVTADYSRVLLDTSVTRRQLDAARAALNRGDIKTADNSLRTIEQNVVLESTATRMPLVKARENLTLASTDAARSDWPGVKAQLNAAAKSLFQYGKIAPAADVADVNVVEQQIAAYAPDVESQHGDAASRINGWWVRVANLTDRQS